jgi:hypothetical protein
MVIALAERLPARSSRMASAESACSSGTENASGETAASNVPSGSNVATRHSSWRASASRTPANPPWPRAASDIARWAPSDQSSRSRDSLANTSAAQRIMAMNGVR